jgi:putative flippase GtrA
MLYAISGITFSKDFIDINVSTVMGAMVAMVWNYNGYRLFVFKDKKQDEEDPETA